MLLICLVDKVTVTIKVQLKNNLKTTNYYLPLFFLSIKYYNVNPSQRESPFVRTVPYIFRMHSRHHCLIITIGNNNKREPFKSIKPYILQSNKHHVGHEDQKYIFFYSQLT